MDDPEKLLDDVIAYLKQQQEMFGDFEVQPGTKKQAGESDTLSPENTAKPEREAATESETEAEPVDTETETAESAEITQESTETAAASGAKAQSGDAKPGTEESTETGETSGETTATPDDTESKTSETAESPPESEKSTETSPETPNQATTESGDSPPVPPVGSGKPQSHLFSTNPDASDNIYDQVEACQSLKELYELSKKTDLLRTDLENTNLVFGVGNAEADLVLIGEAPGSEEDKLGEPFVGKAGQLLNKILDAIDLDRDDIYIANILKHRPPKNRNPLPDEIKRSLPFLIKQLDLIQPKLILCLGKVAANTLLDRQGSLKSMRGTFHDFLGRYELMVTYHPAALLRNANYKRPTWEDVKKLRKRYDELGCEPSK